MWFKNLKRRRKWFILIFTHSIAVLSFLEFQSFFCYNFLDGWRTSFSYSLRVDLLATNILSFLSLENVLFPIYSWWIVSLNIKLGADISSLSAPELCDSFLCSIVSDEKSSIIWISFTQWTICNFSLAALKTFSLTSF